MAYRRNKLKSDVSTGLGCIVPFILMFAFFAVAYLNHLIWVFGAMMNEIAPTSGKFFLAVVGTLFPPIGVYHGIYLWFV